MTAPWRRRLATWLRTWAVAIEATEPTTAAVKSGERLYFTRVRVNLWQPVYEVLSRRGDIVLGTVEWSNQWRLPKFTPHREAVFDKQALAELYVLMRDWEA